MTWARSCCSYCPFQASSPRHDGALITRWKAHPKDAVDSLLIEYRALALNENSKLFGNRSGVDIVRQHAPDDLYPAFSTALERIEWSVYEVRRILHPRSGNPTLKGPAWRSIEVHATGDRAAMDALLDQFALGHGGQVHLDANGIARCRLRRRGRLYPALEHELVVGPAGALTKQRPGFEAAWRRLTAPTAPLF